MRVCQFRHIRDCKSYDSKFQYKSQVLFQKIFKNIFAIFVDKKRRRKYTKIVNKGREGYHCESRMKLIMLSGLFMF